ncbi:hypothetical protein [Streptomyces marincola]|uniref:hypothetical protein n=1 Tax=Streptomyces marincola TaxID=2878388 RepID=UPI001CF5292E|nr:hypothetical protein [Streptomyces marincola]UCM86673.1 hypothetical protein LC193_01255 [Streptomyces marincola]
MAHRVLDTLRGVEGTAPLADFVDGAADPKAALAAVRVVGADTLAPQALAGGAPHPRDTAILAQAATVFPAPVHSPAPPEGSAENWAVAWRDWATARLLERHADGGPEPHTPQPATGPALAPKGSWQSWNVLMAQLAPLSLPGVEGPVSEAARRHPVSLARGVTRAMLRRDYPTAARLARWTAALHRDRVPLPIDPVPLVEHLGLHAGGGPRLALDLAIARALLGTDPGRTAG